MHQHPHHRHDTVLLSGWLFADLLLGLMMIFLMAVPGISPRSTVEPVLTVSPASLDPKSDQCTGEMSNLKCTVTLGEMATSQGDMTWTANSNMSNGVTFSPTNGMLSPGKSVNVTITAIPCQEGSFTFSGSRGAHPVAVSWQCAAPRSLDFNPRTFTLTIADINGLLNSTQSSIDNIEGQVKSQQFLNRRSVGIAIVRGGAGLYNDSSNIAQAKQIAGRIYRILQMLGQDNFAFQNSAYYLKDDPLYDIGTDPSIAKVDVYLFKQ